MESILKIWTVIIIMCAVFSVSQSVERYMCRDCQYQSNMADTTCIFEAENMTDIPYKVRCEGLCLILSRWSKETMQPTFLVRGCSNMEPDTEDTCVESRTEFECRSQCRGHYCNVDIGLTPDGSQKATSNIVVVTVTSVLIYLFQ